MTPPLRVAIVGAGPAGIYAADILTTKDPQASVDIFDRLPTPYGLIRYGVAPDHPRIKAIIVALHRVLENERIRFIGNVHVGVDIKVDELRHHYDAVIFATGAERDRSLRIFDRSFAVTYWLQAVAIGIGLFGVAASFSAQVLARRKEFGLLAHLGLTRRQILAVVAGEGAAWTGIGAIAGVLLGLAVSVVLVHVVNPQSFHWTMEMNIPAPRLWALCAAVVVSGTVTAWLAGRAAAGRDAVMAVKEDW